LFDSQFRRRLPRMLQDIFGITQRETLSIEDISDKKRLESMVEEIKRPYVRLADYWLNAFFGGEAGDYLSLLGNIEGQSESTIPNDERRFFHWELEYPEVFFESAGTMLHSPGFDAILGNPPWGGENVMALLSQSPSEEMRSAAGSDAKFFGLARSYASSCVAGNRCVR
jgi:hypothetical protein